MTVLEHHYEADQKLTADQLQIAYDVDPGEHPVFSRDDWVYDVANHDTTLGYWEWLEDMLRSWSFFDLEAKHRKGY